MTETLISSLSQIPNLNLKARSSVFRYKGKETDARTIGKELNVQAIVHGRIVQRGQELILYLELVDASTGNRIWGDQYNRKTAGLVSLQSEIALDVSKKLKTKLSGADERRLAKNYTENAEAYQLYSAVVGSITVFICETRFAGKPPRRACSRTISSSGAI